MKIAAIITNFSLPFLIFQKISFHIKSEGGPISRMTEVKESFRNFSPMRPIIMRLADHLKVSNSFGSVLSQFYFIFFTVYPPQ